MYRWFLKVVWCVMRGSRCKRRRPVIFLTFVDVIRGSRRYAGRPVIFLTFADVGARALVARTVFASGRIIGGCFFGNSAAATNRPDSFGNVRTSYG